MMKPRMALSADRLLAGHHPGHAGLAVHVAVDLDAEASGVAPAHHLVPLGVRDRHLGPHHERFRTAGGPADGTAGPAVVTVHLQLPLAALAAEAPLLDDVGPTRRLVGRQPHGGAVLEVLGPGVEALGVVDLDHRARASGRRVALGREGDRAAPLRRTLDHVDATVGGIDDPADRGTRGSIGKGRRAVDLHHVVVEGQPQVGGRQVTNVLGRSRPGALPLVILRAATRGQHQHDGSNPAAPSKRAPAHHDRRFLPVRFSYPMLGMAPVTPQPGAVTHLA